MPLTPFFAIDGKSFTPMNRAWDHIIEEVCGWLGIDPPTYEDDAHSLDLYWGGEHSDENSIEVVTVDGEVVGSWDRAIIPEELDLIKRLAAERIAERAEQHRALMARAMNRGAA